MLLYLTNQSPRFVRHKNYVHSVVWKARGPSSCVNLNFNASTSSKQNHPDNYLKKKANNNQRKYVAQVANAQDKRRWHQGRQETDI
jgi:hypothetical protein